MKATQTQNVPGERVGFMNHVFGVLYRIRLPFKALRRKSKPAYYTLKFTFLLGLLAALVFLV